jgi:hypothetical protein
MAEHIPTPVCEATGLPLPVRQTLTIEPINWALFNFKDYHHHFHPERSPELVTEEGRALRVSRGQWLPKELHNRYHKLFDGPPLPVDIDEVFRLTVLSCAGVVPREALDLSKRRSYKKVGLRDEEFELLAAPNSIFIEKAHSKGASPKRRIIGQFLVSYALKQDLYEVISDRVIEQFLYRSTSAERRKELGNYILREALDMSVDGLAAEHRELRREGYSLPGRPATLFDAQRKLLPKNDLPSYYRQVASNLRAA